MHHRILDSVHLLMDKRLMFMTAQEVHIISILSRPPGWAPGFEASFP